MPFAKHVRVDLLLPLRSAHSGRCNRGKMGISQCGDRAGRYWSGDRSRLPSPEAQECGMPHSPGPEGARAWVVLQLVKGGSLVCKDVSA